MRNLLRSAAILTTVTATPVVAEDSVVVVELFTSQGCSSCPPADAMLAELATRDNVVAMALHVDYWDYIGWADKFAKAEHTQRQEDYARAAGQATIYTPQFVIGGEDLVVGAKAMKLADTIQAHTDTVQPVRVLLERNGADGVTISAELDGDSVVSGPFVIQMARLMDDQSVEIRRGENAGKTLTYTNIVSALDVIHQWDGQEPVTLQTTVPQDTAFAVFVQSGTNGPIVGAAKQD